MGHHTNKNRPVKRTNLMAWAIAGLLISVFLTWIYVGLNRGPDIHEIVPVESEQAVVVEEDPNEIVNGIHVRTGLVEGVGLMETVNNCTACHSAKLITQNRMDHDRWKATIQWMQETQNLWDLGANEEVIINYLVTNYPPVAKGRRAPLRDVQWYDLKE